VLSAYPFNIRWSSFGEATFGRSWEARVFTCVRVYLSTLAGFPVSIRVRAARRPARGWPTPLRYGVLRKIARARTKFMRTRAVRVYLCTCVPVYLFPCILIPCSSPLTSATPT
jgi:hypothetical protein